MGKLIVTKDFQAFINGIFIENYNEVYELYQVAIDNEQGQSTYIIQPCKGSDDRLIIYEPTNHALRLSPKALEYFPNWIEQKLMNGLDAESHWAMERAKEKDKWEEGKRG